MTAKGKLTVATLAALAAVISVILALNSPLSRFLAPPVIPGARNNLHTARILNVPNAFGPESLSFDPDGDGPYVGVADGRILRWEGERGGWVDFAFTSSADREKCMRPFAPEMEHVCGRPLGLRFYKRTGDLYIADAYFGLLVVGPAGGLASPVATEVKGEPFRFTNDLDIDEAEDVIYFTDSSTRFQRRQFMSSAIRGDTTGRLMKFDKSTMEVKVLLRGLAFANGVALSKDRSFILVAESSSCRITRLWLKGPNAGKSDVFAELPGFPDNIRSNSKGEFWVALHSKKGITAKLLLSSPSMGNLILKLPLSFKQLHGLFVGYKPHATIMKLSEEAEVLEVLEDIEGQTLRFISEVEERDGKLLMGSVMTPFVGILDKKRDTVLS